jgi:hypothetical protein
MKTPRELLLERHRSQTRRLDEIRREVVEGLERSARRPAGGAVADRPASFLIQWFVGLRWHWAAISVAWVIVVLVDAEPVPSSRVTAGTVRPVPAELVASLRENRRQVIELLEPSTAKDERRSLPESLPPPRRSERRTNGEFDLALV